MDVTALSDDELGRMLTEHGFTPGPIIDSTRRVYQKKLQRLLETDVHAEGSFQSPNLHDQEYSSADDDEDDDDFEPVTQRTRSSRQRPQTQETHSYQSSSRTSAYSSSTMAGDSSQLTRRSLRGNTSSFAPSNLVTQVEPPPQESKQKGGMSLCAKLIIFAIIALVVFFVVQNMEPAAKDPVAKLGGGV